jgi:hypothetical protein
VRLCRRVDQVPSATSQARPWASCAGPSASCLWLQVGSGRSSAAARASLASGLEYDTKRGKYIGYFASEEDKARAYDFAAVQAHGPGANRKNTRALGGAESGVAVVCPVPLPAPSPSSYQ